MCAAAGQSAAVWQGKSLLHVPVSCNCKSYPAGIALAKEQTLMPLSGPCVSVEIATLTRENGKTVIRVLKQKEVEQLIKQHEEEEAKAEREKKEKEQKEKDK